MSKTWLIIKREYLTRVRKKSFILMSLLGPLIMAGVIISAIWLSIQESEEQHILVIDDNYPLFKDFDEGKTIQYEYVKISFEQAEQLFENSHYTGLLYLPKNIVNAKSARLYFHKQPSYRVQRQIEMKLQERIEINDLENLKISESDYRRLKTPITLLAFQFDETGQHSEKDQLPAIVGLVFAVLIYFFIFLYSVQVMRGVIEEKTSRIIEVLASSVKPIQMMLGKIVGVGAVGMTQFILWVLLTLSITLIGQSILLSKMYSSDAVIQHSQMTNDIGTNQGPDLAKEVFSQSNNSSLINQLGRVNFPLMLSVFLFYFIGGYFLYSAMMAAVGSAVDNDTDTQQFVFPVTFPLLFSYMVSFIVIENPEGPLAIWLSIIPFTSPVIMMVRIAFGLQAADIWQLYVSMAALVVTFIFMTWIASKVYRTGILIYGKKASIKEIWKWIKY